MRFFSFFFFIVFSLSTSVLGGVDQALIDNVFAMTSSGYKKDTDPISRPVQTINMLAHELSLYKEEERATAVAKSIISMITKGEGVKGGLRKKAHKRRLLNESEKELTINAITKAVDYLQKQNLFDQFLRDSIEGMVGVWVSDEATRNHGSTVLSLLLAASEKTKGNNNIDLAKAEVEKFIPDHTAPIRKALSSDNTWRYAKDYMATEDPHYIYNAAQWKAIEVERQQELATDKREKGITNASFLDYLLKYDGGKFKVAPLTVESTDTIKNLVDELSSTLIPEKAYAFSLVFMGSIKHKDTDLITLRAPATGAERGFREQIIRALAAVERFRMFELGISSLDKTVPKVLNYKNSDADPQSQAIIIALDSAIQNYFYRPNSSLDDLKDLFGYQKNDSTITPGVKAALDILNPDLFINQGLLGALQNPLRITKRQKILIDQEALKQKLIYEAVPEFDFATDKMTLIWRFLRFINSRGDGQCGYYSLRNIVNGKAEYKKKIIDNLKNEGIRILAERLTYVGRNLHTDLLKSTAKPTVKQTEIIKRIQDIEKEKDSAKQEIWPDRIPDEDAENARLLSDSFEIRKEPLFTELAVTANLSETDLADLVSKEIDNIDNGGWLDIGSNAAWQDQALTFPFVTALLNHDDIYVWIQTQHKGHKKPIYVNAVNFLANFVSAKKDHLYHSRRIHLFNSNGKVHYDKWVEDDNYPDLVDALRHKNLFTLGNTR